MSVIYFNGKIITMTEQDGESSVKNAPEAILVDEGKIKAVGSYSELKNMDVNAEEFDLEGKCLMPAFVDGHGHCCWAGKRAMIVDLSDCRNHSEVVEKIRDYIEKYKPAPGTNVIADRYVETQFEENAHPDKRVLDRCSTEHAIYVVHKSGHTGCVNSYLLDLAGIDENTPDPYGGHIERIPGSNEPTGYLEEAAFNICREEARKHFVPEIELMAAYMQESYLKHGITTIQEGNSVPLEFETMKAMAERQLLDVDVVSYLSIPGGSVETMHKEFSEYGHGYNNRLKIGGYKIILDGSINSKTAYVSKPYVGEESYCGLSGFTDEQLFDMTLIALKENKQLLCHCIGDQAAEQFLNAYEKALAVSGNTNELRPMMVHCYLVRKDQLDRMAKLNMMATLFSGQIYLSGERMEGFIGRERADGLCPAKDCLDRGIVINFHQDTPITDANMLHTIWCAVNRVGKSGQVYGADNRISVYDALKAATVGGAYLYFEENQKGKLQPGFLADLVIMDRSPLEADPLEIKDIQVLKTIKEGRTVWEKK